MIESMCRSEAGRRIQRRRIAASACLLLAAGVLLDPTLLPALDEGAPCDQQHANWLECSNAVYISRDGSIPVAWTRMHLLQRLVEMAPDNTSSQLLGRLGNRSKEYLHRGMVPGRMPVTSYPALGCTVVASWYYRTDGRFSRPVTGKGDDMVRRKVKLAVAAQALTAVTLGFPGTLPAVVNEGAPCSESQAGYLECSTATEGCVEVPGFPPHCTWVSRGLICNYFVGDWEYRGTWIGSAFPGDTKTQAANECEAEWCEGSCPGQGIPPS
jgi:hypothetical protein